MPSLPMMTLPMLSCRARAVSRITRDPFVGEINDGNQDTGDTPDSFNARRRCDYNTGEKASQEWEKFDFFGKVELLDVRSWRSSAFSAKSSFWDFLRIS